MINEEYLFRDKTVKVYDRKVITTKKRRGALLSIGFLTKKQLEGKIARLFVKKINDESYIIYLKLIQPNSNNKN